MMRTIRTPFFLLLFLLSCSADIHASILLQGDSNSSTQTFSFPILANVATGTNFYVGALTTGGKEFSLARIGKNELQFLALAPASVTLDGVPGIDNPFYNQGIKFLDVLSAEQGNGVVERAVLVTTNPAQAANLYMVDRTSAGHPANVLSVENIQDAQGSTSAGIVGIGATFAGNSGAFAAVLPNAGGSFGNSGSGIAVINLQQMTIENNKVFIASQLAANPNSSLVTAVPFDLTSSFLTIGDSATSMTNIVDLHWNSFLKRLYVTVQITGGAAGADGVRAIAVGQINNEGKLTFQPIAPSSVFTAGANNEIVGSIGSSAQVSLSKVTTMHTTMGLDYLVVVGGNGSPSATNNEVFVLPIVNTITYGNNVIADPVIQGTLANVTATPTDIFANQEANTTLQWREITQAATTPQQIYTTSSAQARVGGGPLAAGSIIDLLVIKDAIYAVVGNAASASELPGIFYSQALFDAYGRINNWTPWQRVAGNANSMFGMFFDVQFGDITFMTGSSSSLVQNVQRTQWGTGDASELQPMGQMLVEELPSAHGGIQGFFNFAQNTPGLVNISALVATGLNKVVLVESGFTNGSGAFVPNAGSFVHNKQSIYNGVISPAPNAQVLSITGGALNNFGPIIAAEIGVDSINNNAWLFVGGDGGLIVLTNADGSGWNASSGLQSGFVGLPNNSAFKRIGNYKFVRSLIADNNFLYVLTDKQLDRIDLHASNFGTGALVSTTVATTQIPAIFGAKGAFLSLVISGKFALLSTTQGLYRVGNNNDISSASSANDVGWTLVPVNEAAGSVSQLIALSGSGRSQDVARMGGGNIYALNGFVGFGKGQVNRFSIADVTNSAISDTTIQPIPDMTVKGINSYFKNFGTYANQFATDGSLNLYSRNHELRRPSFLNSAQRGTVRNNVNIPLNIEPSADIAKIIRNTASGSWMIFGDFARFNE